MPRTAKRPKGAPATPDVATGQAYGVASEQREALAAQPMPEAAPPAGGGAPMQAPLPAPPEGMAGMPAPADPFAAALSMAPPDPNEMLFAESGRPDEPVTAGAPVGAGPGSEVLTFAGAYRRNTRRGPGPTTQALEALVAAGNGNPALAALLERARQRGA